MAVIQSKINQPFTEELVERFLDNLSDYSEEQLNFERGELGMHATSEDSYLDWSCSISSVVEEYHEDLDLFDILDLEMDKDGNFIFEDALSDLASSYQISINNHLAKEKLKTLPNSEFINDMAINFMSNLEERIDVSPDFFDKKVNSENEYNRIFVDIIIDLTQEKIKSFFNKETLGKNPLYKHIGSLIKKSVEDDYENFLSMNEGKEIKRPYYFKHSKDPDLTFKEASNVLEIQKKYINLVKNKAKLPKDDPQYFNLLESSSFEDMYDGLTKMVKRSELDKYMKRFVGSYKHLINEETIERFEEIKKRNINEKLIRYNLSKISLMEDSEALNAALDKTLSNNSNSFDYVKMNIENENLNAPVIFENNDFLVVAMLDFKASQKLSASSWCISSNRNYYERYSQNDNFNISVYYNKASYGNAMSHMGLTINEEGDISYAFDKNNGNILGKIGRTVDRIMPEVTKGLKLREAYSELMLVDKSLENINAKDMKFPVFVINRMDKKLFSKLDVSSLSTEKSIKDFKEYNKRVNAFSENEIEKEIDVFKEKINVHSSKDKLIESEIKDFVNKKMAPENKTLPKKIRPH